MPAAHHREAVGMMEITAAGEQRDGLLAGVDELPVLLSGGGGGAHAEQAVLTLEEDLSIEGQIVGDLCRQANAEVHIGAFGNVAGDAGGHLVTVQMVHEASPGQAAMAWGRAGAISTTR